jgi:hypothetical protein
MELNKYLASRVQEVLLDGKWIANTNFKEQIVNTKWEKAIAKTGNHNSIAVLTFHINYYLKGLIQVFDGGPLDIKDKYSFDIQDIDSEAKWIALVDEFILNASIFVNKVQLMDEHKLYSPFVDEKYGSYLRNIEGVIEHSYYHLGQVSLINKLLQDS